MKKTSPIIWKIAYNVGLLIAIVQILLGAVWAAMNARLVPSFPETRLLLEMSETWILDEYVGAGYVVLIYFARCLQNLIGVPYQAVIYLLQAALACYGVYRLLKSIAVLAAKTPCKKLLIWASLYINTIPFLLQGHFAVLPYSLAAAMYVLLLANLLELMHMAHQTADKSEMLLKLALIVGLWVLAALLMPEYLLLSGVIVLLALLYAGIVQKSWRGFCAIAIVLGVLIGGTVLALTTEEGSRGRVQNTFESQAMRRFAWSYLDAMEWFWPWEIIDCFDAEELVYYVVEPSRTVELFGPKAETLFGKETANQYFGEMAFTAITLNTKEVAGQFVVDYGYYLCPQVVATYNLAGRGVTYTGQNYGIMQTQGSMMARLLVRWGILSFVVLGIMGVVSLVRNKVSLRWVGLTLIALFSQAFCWTWLTAGMISYLVCPVNMILWGILLTAWLWAKDGKAETE